MNFETYRGDNAAFDLTVTKSGVPVNLTGATLRFSAKLDKSDVAAVISKVSSDATQISITNAAGGLATVFLVPADTADYDEVTVLFWDVQVTDSLGKVYTLAEGRLKIKIDVTTS